MTWQDRPSTNSIRFDMHQHLICHKLDLWVLGVELIGTFESLGRVVQVKSFEFIGSCMMFKLTLLQGWQLNALSTSVFTAKL